MNMFFNQASTNRIQKILCLALIIVLCLAFCCSCNSKNDDAKTDNTESVSENAKYVGKYMQKRSYGINGKRYSNEISNWVHTDDIMVPVIEYLILNDDGTGVLETEQNPDEDPKGVPYEDSLEKLLEDETFEWYVEDGYVVVTFAASGDRDSYTKTFEKKVPN